MGSSFIHLIRTDSNEFLFNGWVIVHGVYVAQLHKEPILTEYVEIENFVKVFNNDYTQLNRILENYNKELKEIHRIQSKRWRGGNYERRDNRLVGQTEKMYHTVNQRSKNKRNWEWDRGNIWRYKDWTVCKTIRKHQYMDSRSISNPK